MLHRASLEIGLETTLSVQHCARGTARVGRLSIGFDGSRSAPPHAEFDLLLKDSRVAVNGNSISMPQLLNHVSTKSGQDHDAQRKD